ncbi:MAG: DNA double-strand break repair nuclease NurA [Limisphaerales bacterium]
MPSDKKRKLSVKERLQQPHILGEMVKLSLTHSSQAQKDFLQQLERIAAGIRDMLEAAEMIRSVEIDHRAMWSAVADNPISFVDGGMANVASLGAEPVAVRVGSYTVIPGRQTPDREQFRMEKQLVAELFDLSSSDGIFEDLFEDPSKLRDAVRFCLEASAGVQCIARDPKPEFLFLHGALVNPVSAYADEHFPAFSARGLEILLPPKERNRTGREAKFVSVYLHLLKTLQESKVNVASVVERASGSMLVSTTLLDLLKTSDVSPGAGPLEETKHRIKDYRIPDAVLFHAILNEGEYLTPVAVDRNVDSKRPNYSRDIIAQYPLPHVTYVGVGQFAQPLRVEFFEEPPAGFEMCVRLVVHACRLMPNYAFPAGLDIVDKFAKVPNWMSRPIHSTMAVQLMKRAMDTGNPKMVEAAKRMLCGTTRDWLFRPNWNG